MQQTLSRDICTSKVNKYKPGCCRKKKWFAWIASSDHVSCDYVTISLSNIKHLEPTQRRVSQRVCRLVSFFSETFTAVVVNSLCIPDSHLCCWQSEQHCWERGAEEAVQKCSFVLNRHCNGLDSTHQILLSELTRSRQNAEVIHTWAAPLNIYIYTLK